MKRATRFLYVLVKIHFPVFFSKLRVKGNCSQKILRNFHSVASDFLSIVLFFWKDFLKMLQQAKKSSRVLSSVESAQLCFYKYSSANWKFFALKIYIFHSLKGESRNKVISRYSLISLMLFCIAFIKVLPVIHQAYFL